MCSMRMKWKKRFMMPLEYFDIGSTNDTLSDEQPPTDSTQYEKLFEQLKTPLYKDCNANISALIFVVKLMHLKIINK